MASKAKTTKTTKTEKKVEPTIEKLNAIGALWQGQSATGLPYLSGNIEVNGEKIKIFALVNGGKEKNQMRPDWRIFLSRTKTQ